MTSHPVIRVTAHVQHRWAMRLGIWLLSLCTVEVFADSKSLGRKRAITGDALLRAFLEEKEA